MWRRYVLAFVGAVTGGVPPLWVGLDWRTSGAVALAVAGVLVAAGERWKLVPTSAEAFKVPSILPDESDRRR